MAVDYVALDIVKAGQWSGDAVDSVTLDYDERHRRRITLHTALGKHVLLDLRRPAALADGDALLTDGGIVVVRARAEALLAVSCPDPDKRARIAWQLGNRHLPVEFAGPVLFIRHDHVIADMLRGLGAEVEAVQRGFQPEGGAYGEGRVLSHSHHHGSGHSHDHHHDHEHRHD
jgi:urease accessory protein